MVEAPGDDPAGLKIAPGRPPDGPQVNTVMLPEMRVFSGQKGGDDHLRQRARRQQDYPSPLAIGPQAQDAVLAIQNQDAGFWGQSRQLKTRGLFQVDAQDA